MNKIITLVIAVVISSLSVWVMPTLEQKAFANWGPWYQCGGHGYLGSIYSGSYYYYQQYCDTYYGKNGIVLETIEETCYWKYLNGWFPAGCSSPVIVYLCNPNTYPVQCNTV
jgi:hypothetical protein